MKFTDYVTEGVFKKVFVLIFQRGSNKALPFGVYYSKQKAEQARKDAADFTGDKITDFRVEESDIKG